MELEPRDVGKYNIKLQDIVDSKMCVQSCNIYSY